MLNQQIGSYKIISKLGEGGMANVYLAEKGTLSKKVALKVLKDEFLLNQHIRNRFLSEARKMSGLNQANIVGVHDLIDETNFVAIELDYVEGKTLKQHLHENGALPDVEIEALFKQMLDALAYIHEKGFVHRDVKPSNFMLTDNGIIKLTDFGIAKNVDDSNMDYTGTGTGMQMGTPKYMSPEQVRSTKDVDHRTDIYSLGVVLWEMVTGKVPYDIQTSSTFDVFTKIVNEPLEKTNTRWDDIIEKTTRKEPKDRYPNTHTIVLKKTIISDPKTKIKSSNKTTDVKPPIRLMKNVFFVIAILAVFIGVYIAHQKDLESREYLEHKKQMKIANSRTFEDSRDGKTYKWVKIGNQTWMAENLAYKPNYGNYWAYNNDFSNVAKYGYLYDWETACEVCPEGWHLPSDDEWKELEMELGMSAIDANKKSYESSRGSNEGYALKSRDFGGGNNSSFFTALPGGYRSYYDKFFNEEMRGYWWTATENGLDAWKRHLGGAIQGGIYRDLSRKKSALSVRCLKENKNEVVAVREQPEKDEIDRLKLEEKKKAQKNVENPVEEDVSIDEEIQAEQERLEEKKYEEFKDPRDGKIYKTVKIGNQVWMAENLAYQVTNGNYWAYDNNWRNISKYGYLYDWETACKVCPNGWHLPSDNEWTQLTSYLGGAKVAGNKMKNTSGWKDNGNGTNISGFSGVPGGTRNYDGSFFSISSYGSYWSSTTANADNARFRLLNYNNSVLTRSSDSMNNGFSVRCIRN